MSHVQLLIVFDKPAEESAVAAAALLSFSIARPLQPPSPPHTSQLTSLTSSSPRIAAIENYPRNEL